FSFLRRGMSPNLNLMTLGYSHTLSYFDTTICGSEAAHSKPEPDIFLKACEKLHVLPSEALVLEDSEAGIEAAYRAHIKVICIPDMKYPTDEYVNKAFKVLDSLDEVINELEKGIES
ncbi:MAG: HAD family hydrolase, partial [Erysipelotrichaceae bacterium]|nr:HAD family hydrolase [Erysipelotrichaceae bacterium]